MMKEARETSKGHNWAIELLIFLCVVIVASIPIGLVTGIGTSIYLISNPEFTEVMRNSAGNIPKYTETVNNLMQNIPEWITVLMLFCEAIMIGIAFVYCRKIENRKLSTLGFRKDTFISKYLIGLLLGFGFFSIAVLICSLTGSIKITGFSPECSIGLVVAYFIGYMIQGMAEEVVCRGYLLVSISRKYSIPVAVMLSSFAFALLHISNTGVTALAIINLTLFGILAALIMIKEGNIWMVAGLHTMWNFTQGNIFGIEVSGLSQQNSIFNSDMVQSKTLINGGSFGLEGGFAVTIVLLVGIGIVLFRAMSNAKQMEDEIDVVEPVEVN